MLGVLLFIVLGILTDAGLNETGFTCIIIGVIILAILIQLGIHQKSYREHEQLIELKIQRERAAEKKAERDRIFEKKFYDDPKDNSH